MSDSILSRRSFVSAAAVAAAAGLAPIRAAAAARVIAAAFPGDTEDNLRKILTPRLAAKGVDITFAPILAQDQVGKMMASPGRPPYDALYVSPGQTVVLIEKGLISKIDSTKLPSWSQLEPQLGTEWGPAVHLQIDGIAYNPRKVPKPKGYRDLFENPAYDGRVAFLGFASNTATVAWVEIAKIYGGGPDNLDPMFALLKKHLSKLGAIANSGQHQMSLYQQGEVDVFIASTGNVARLKSLGASVEFAQPESGSPALPVYIHLAKGASDPDAVHAYMEASISVEVQEILKGPPLAYFPTNRNVELPPEISAYFTREHISSLVYPDWITINANRAKWTEEFNRVVKS